MPRLPRSASRLLLHLRLLWQAAPALSLVCLGLSILHALAAVAAMISSGRLLGALADALAGGDPAPVWTWLIATAVALVAGPLLASISGGVEELTGARYLSAYQDLLLDTATRPYSVAGVRSAAGAETLDRASNALQHWLFLRGVGGLWGVIASRLAGLGALVIVVGWNWWVAAALLAGWLLVSRSVARWRSVMFDETEGDAVPLLHRSSYLYGLAAGRPAAKEVRLFGLADWLIDSYVSLRDRAMAEVTAARGAAVRRTVLPLIVLLLLHGGAFAVLTSDALAGTISVAALATLVQALLALSAFGRQDDDETSLGRTVSELGRLVELRKSLGLPFPVPSGPFDRLRERKPSRPPDQAARIELCGLTFRYPGSESPVLEDLELIIEPGECVAIVGPNGAGKSTLLGLLCGLWAPVMGTVRIDGRDPAADPLARRPDRADLPALPPAAADRDGERGRRESLAYRHRLGGRGGGLRSRRGDHRATRRGGHRAVVGVRRRHRPVRRSVAADRVGPGVDRDRGRGRAAGPGRADRGARRPGGGGAVRVGAAAPRPVHHRVDHAPVVLGTERRSDRGPRPAGRLPGRPGDRVRHP